ncbi:MAG: serine/threonine protein kinase [Candidatus Abyssobacteria bacterium SURF_17]|uniref:Serine/threonine protein kinase n=1 Tax=Candidatus Abyssobacteria bacterium SURF_17 TaxID=2093361 RepID=A0A419EUN2_9BACT|nr:MAG: serine/threonine protein kinase [Candidatus Abyssubacteria bacterium SURF_17]
MPIEERIGNYRILSPIAAGGMGRVYLAKEETNERHIAVKVLPDEFLKDRKRSQYLEREVKIARQLKHPNVIDIYGLHVQKGIGYLLMEFMDGGNLRQHIQTRNPSLYEVLSLIVKICTGLHYIHHHKFGDARFHSIIHRDIKPENILLSQKEEVKVADFGLSMPESSWGWRGLSTRAGTPFYMSPEQIRGKSLDIRTDIYSLGLVMYELLTGQLPYKAQDKVMYMKTVISKKNRPAPPSFLDKRIPRQFDEITLKALEYEPTARYQTVAELMLDLKRLPPVFKQLSA